MNMKTLLAAIVSVMTVVALILIVLKSRSESSSRNSTLEQKLSVLAECGLKLSEPFTVTDLLKSSDREELEKPGYNLTLAALGSTEEEEPLRNLCVNLWYFDTECIEGDDAYKRIAARMSEVTQGSLPLTDIQSHVDIDGGNAWLSFSFRGENIKLNCRVDNDWVDPSIFSRFVQLLSQADPSKLYIYYNLGGQDCLIGCVTKKELQKLNAKGIKFEPLNK
jgi:hypothetical protein